MPADEYASATGGSLKLKGVNKSSKVSKSHKKKKPRPEKQNPSSNLDKATEEAQDETSKAGKESSKVDEEALMTTKSETEIEADLEAEISARNRGKTEAELRHEERRRRRLDERLKREGIKTHKERVEELNRYLSNLSEHHDIPTRDDCSEQDSILVAKIFLVGPESDQDKVASARETRLGTEKENSRYVL